MVKSVKRYRIYLVEHDVISFIVDAHEMYKTDRETYCEFRTFDRGFFYSTLSVKAKDIKEFVNKLEMLFDRPLGYRDITPGTFPETKEYVFCFQPSGIKADTVKATSLNDAMEYMSNKLGDIPSITVTYEEWIEELRPSLIRKLCQEKPELKEKLAGETLFVEVNNDI